MGKRRTDVRRIVFRGSRSDAISASVSSPKRMKEKKPLRSIVTKGRSPSWEVETLLCSGDPRASVRVWGKRGGVAAVADVGKEERRVDGLAKCNGALKGP